MFTGEIPGENSTKSLKDLCRVYVLYERKQTCKYRGDDKSLARPGRKQATMTKLFFQIT